MTVKLIAVPAVALAGALTTKCVAAAALTVIALLVPVRLLAASVAVSVWLPAVTRVALKVAWPLVSALLAGNFTAALGSVLVNATVPV